MALGFFFDMQNCIGCRTCQVACKDRLDIQTAGARTRRVDSFEVGTFPGARAYHRNVSCNHCADPACVAACPTGAMFKDDETGIVLHNAAECILCQTCVSACPYGAPQYYEQRDIIVKCDSCKDLREAGKKPVCVEACPMRALDFGDMDELETKYGQNCVNELPCMPSAAQTGPNLLVNAKECALENDFVEIVI